MKDPENAIPDPHSDGIDAEAVEKSESTWLPSTWSIVKLGA